ncbi:TonB-dependent receptor domain-containing protein [Aurantiacibacter spongiae]|uniref:TonB-dependent receptor n=1 Tax=Aurantiacibacter spongiae TaxID=2488860 RepID=A0A3N5DNE5_9SPHN|nr:TonB-dependent receptor [Aurantiacibacter spongiae]RPF70571.1 TonB-dependent receptor [Aurantiacibacter spongiae]
MQIIRKKVSLLTGTIMATAMLSAPVYAQDDGMTEPATEPGASTPGEAIVVTGSRIQRRNVETAAPVAVVQDEEFELSGTVNVENVVNTLPQVVPGITSNSNNPGNGTASLNLRGLGEERTLVLVNGRRWMFYDTNQIVDLNTIPSFLIDSVDVVTGGASAVYGSDALAGVVNFRLKEVNGIEFGGQYSITDRGDGDRYEITGAIGSDFADGRGNVTVYGEYYNRKPVFQADREFSAFNLGGDPLVQGGSSFIPESRVNYQGNGSLAGTQFAGGGNFLFDPAGSARPYTGADAYNFAPVNYLQLPQDRYLLGGYASYEVFPFLEAYTEVSYVNNQVNAALAPTPIQVNANLDIDSLSQFLDPSVVADLRQIDATETGDQANDGAVLFQVNRRLLEAGPRLNQDERNAFRVVGGIRGPIGNYLSYDAYYLYARTRNANIQQGNASLSKFIAGLDGTAVANGGIPINVFGLNSLTQDQVDSFIIQAQNGDESELQVASAAVSGTFGDFRLGTAEAVGFALGTEYREVASRFIPDTFLASGDVAGFNAGEPTQGGYNVKEVFGELNVPFETESGFRVELSGAGRYSDYSLDAVGGVWTYAGGIEIAPTPDITFRGQYQRAVRAPNVAELFAGSFVNFPQATDPCSTSAATSGALRDLCIANGVPAGSVGTPGIQPDSQIQVQVGGNPNLQEETSDSYTFGVVLQPRFVPGFTLTADYFDITVDDAIQTIGLQTSLDLCYLTAGDLNDPRCAGFVNTRNPDGSFSRTNSPQLGGANVAELATSGIDLQMAYSMPIPFSLFTDTGEQDLELSFLGTWFEKADTAPDQNDPDNVIRCAGKFGVTCGAPTPSFKWTSRATFTDGPLTTSFRWRHLSAVNDDDPATDYFVERISAYDLLDLTLSFDFNENVRLTAGVLNIFDTLPSTPVFDANGVVTNNTNSLLLGDRNNAEQANTWPTVYDVLGRDFFASVLFRF